jgi:hypothetical protein
MNAEHIVVQSHYSCCHWDATVRSLVIVVGVHVAVNNIKVFIFSVVVQQWLPFALLASKKVFCTAVNNNKYLIL